jgi:hypothetical protein
MPLQALLRLAEFDVSFERGRVHAQQSGGATKETAGWPRGEPLV